MILRNSLNSEMVFDYCSLYQDDAVEILHSNGKDSSLLYNNTVQIISGTDGHVHTIGIVNQSASVISIYQSSLNESSFVRMLTACEDIIRNRQCNKFTRTLRDNNCLWLELTTNQRYERQLLISRYGYVEPSWYDNKVILKLPLHFSRGLTYY